MLAFFTGFVFVFSAAAIFVYRYSATDKKAPAEAESSSPEIYAESETLLLIFEEDGAAGPFTLVCFDPQNGRIPVLTFPAAAVFESLPDMPAAAKVYKELSHSEFAAATEKELGIAVSGWFIWNRNTCETVMAKAGSFDYILPESLFYSDGERYIDLSAGVQSITGKKFYDLVTYPDFDEISRCDVTSRLISSFFGRRLRRFLPEGSALSSSVYSSTENSVDAFLRAELRGAVKALCAEKNPISSHVTCDLDEGAAGELYFSAVTRERIKKYFTAEKMSEKETPAPK